jgi:glycerol-3-phosphate dehydrogenase
MDIPIIGTGNMARALATRALAGGHTVTLLGTSAEKVRALAGLLPHARQLEGAGYLLRTAVQPSLDTGYGSALKVLGCTGVPSLPRGWAL